ncbi:hypothetical protein D9Q98_007299 [Chlorella vulgaris]|uniref:Uncharacterized protein n=1 Tax=Chlorella vulgaris TaxID=3077 RepID=A0A9D4YVM7_CHLVU|nr:hypothetical protein D9Q98_007299 [Chlorella vulgaris]
MHSTLLKTGLGLTQVRKREVPWTDVCESLTAVHLGDPWTCAQAGAPRHRAARRALLASARSRHDQEREMHQSAADVEPLLTKPSRVATGATEGQAMGDSSTPARSGAATGGKAKRGRRPRSDPRKMLNADGDPLNSDPGSLGKLAPGVLEKYEQLDKLKGQEGAPGKAHRPATSASSPSQEPSGGAAKPAPDSDTLKTDSPGGEAQPSGKGPGETPAGPLVPAQKEFEGTGGVLLDVSHAEPQPYHGEGVGRRDAVREVAQAEPCSRDEAPMQAAKELKNEGADFDGFA